nr:hypothetical protein [Neisseria yangbaofengii]
MQRTVGGGFTRPIELVAFASGTKIVFAENQFELLPVDLVFAKYFGEKGFELLEAVG